MNFSQKEKRVDFPRRSIQQALINLYMDIKLRNKEEKSGSIEAKIKAEEMSLKEMDPFMLVDYIKSSFGILLNCEYERGLRMGEERVRDLSTTEEDSSLEKLTQNLEAEIRMHVRAETQQRIRIDALEGQIEENERDIAKLNASIKKLGVDNAGLKEMYNKLQTDKATLKKALAERTAQVDELRHSYKKMQEPLVLHRASESRRILETKENSLPSGVSVTTLRTATLESDGEGISQRGSVVEPPKKPQLQSAYSKLLREIGGTENRPNSRGIDKKMANTTVNPYAPGKSPMECWMEEAEPRKAHYKEKSISRHNNKSTIEEKSHLRSHSHRCEEKRTSNTIQDMLRKAGYNDQTSRHSSRERTSATSALGKAPRPKSSLEKNSGRPVSTFRERPSASRGIMQKQLSNANNKLMRSIHSITSSGTISSNHNII